MSLAKRKSAFFGALLLTALAAGCATQTARVIPFSSVSSFRGPSADQVADYPDALATIMSVMVNDLKFPNLDISLLVYPNVSEFQSGLTRELGMDSVLASQMASFAGGVGAAKKVLINESQLGRHPWSERIKLLTHELTHCVQYAFAKGNRGTSDQWLREGFADWVSYKVMDRLGLDSYARRRQMRLEQVKKARRSPEFPALTQMVSLKEWVTWQNNAGSEATYAQAFLAVDYLIEKKSLGAVVEYFRLFEGSNDRLINFTTAFDEKVTAFEEIFSRHLKDSLEDAPLVKIQ